MKRISITLLPFLLACCSALTGEEVGRLPINKVSREQDFVSKEATVELKAGDEIVFWSEMDFEYEGNVDLRFRVEIQKDGEQYENIQVDPMQKDLTIGETKVTVNGKTTWSFSGQNVIFNVQEDGKYNFKGILVSSDNNSLVVKKAELVLKRI